MALQRAAKLDTCSNRLSLVTGLLFLGLAARWGFEAWRCPTSDSLAFLAVMVTMGGSNIAQYFVAKRDHVALLTWFHTLGFAGLALVAWRDPSTFYIVAAVAWGLLSLIGPLMALKRPVPTNDTHQDDSRLSSAAA
jgi:hypothetical protein